MNITILINLRIDYTDKEIEDFFSCLSDWVVDGIDRTYLYSPVYTGEREMEFGVSEHSPIGSAIVRD